MHSAPHKGAPNLQTRLPIHLPITKDKASNFLLVPIQPILAAVVQKFLLCGGLRACNGFKGFSTTGFPLPFIRTHVDRLDHTCAAAKGVDGGTMFKRTRIHSRRICH